MSAGFLDRVRFRELAEREARVSGSVPLSACPRLRELVEPGPAEIDASLACTRHESGIPLVSGQVDARLAMRCRRCLEPLAVRVRAPLKLAVVADETQLVPATFEAFIAEDGTGRLADLVEEEILLGLPAYPVHERAGECGEVAARVLEHARPAHEPGAFDLLRNLKT
jgi:uncharacterized protein